MASRTTTDPIEILLEMGIDLDNLSEEEDYLSALKEAIATIQFQTKGSGDERSTILQQEVIKVRKKRKAADPKFKVKKTKVSVDNFKKGSATTFKVGQRALPPAIKPKTSIIPYQKSDEVDEEEEGGKKKKVRTRKKKDRDQNLLEGIAKSVDNIAKILKKQYNLKKKSTSYNRKQAERDRRKVQESNLEKGFKGLKKAAEKVIAPVKGILDELLDFFVNILIGRFLYKFFDWLGNPENQKKFDSVVRFFVDFGPTLLAGFLLFGTGIGRFVTRLTFTLVKGASRLIRLLPGWAKIGALLFGAGAVIPQMFPGTVKDDADKQADELAKKVGKEKAAETIRNQQGGFFDFLTGAGQEREEQSQRLETGQEKKYGFFGEVKRFGGAIRSSNKITSNSGMDVTGAGVDTQLIAAQPGEIVINKKTVDAVGADYFLGLNREYGGANANKPKLARVQTASGGGLVLSAFANGGRVGGGPTFAEHANDFKERFIFGDRSILNQLALGNTKGALDALGLKIDINTEALEKNTKSVIRLSSTVGKKASEYISGNKLEKDVSKLMSSSMQFGATLYDQAKKIGEDVISDIQDFNVPEKIKNIKNIPVNMTSGILGNIEKSTSTEGYKKFAGRSNKIQESIIDKNDKFIKNLPPGPLQEIADKGLIPIPTGNAEMMRNLTFAKAMLGPLGKPFKLLSNKEVDKMRKMTIDKTMNKHGLIVDPKTGQVKMNWNQEDINKGARGGGAYTDDLGPGGKKFNSILGRFVATTEGDGNVLYSDDRYNFNKTVAEYAGMAKEQLMKGSIGEAGYFGLSMLGRFAQDIGWLNQRALGSKIKIGEVDRNKLDPKTGKPKTAEQLKTDAKRLATKSFGSPTSASSGKGIYYSSTTGKFYSSYAEALKDPQVKAAANLEEMKKQFTFSSTQQSRVSSLPPPPPSAGTNITVIPKSSAQNQIPGSSNKGSKTNAVNPGAGDRGNWNIFGIPVPKLF